MNYKEAGVDIEEGYRAVGKYRDLAATTTSHAVLNNIGSFAGMYSLKEFFTTMEEPVLVSGTDGVGTKLDIAFRMKKYDTVGIDCVAMCVNDILCHGAQPLFFLDYLACGKLDAEVAAELVKGVATGCREAGAVLLGGETAEMPGFYDEGKYDIAGFAVGIVDRKKIIDGHKIREGDVLLGLASSGAHSNGFSLIRKVIPDLNEGFNGTSGAPGAPGMPVGPIGLALLEPTRIYVRPVLELMKEIEIRGMAHITGGGFCENIPRIFSPSSQLSAEIRCGTWKVPPIFNRIADGIKNAGEEPSAGGNQAIEDPAIKKLMFNTFNMGIGFVLALAPEFAQKAAAFLEKNGLSAWEIGRVEKSSGAAGEVRFV